MKVPVTLSSGDHVLSNSLSTISDYRQISSYIRQEQVGRRIDVTRRSLKRRMAKVSLNYNEH